MVYFKKDDCKPMLLSVDGVISYLKSKPLSAGFTCYFNEELGRLFLTCDVNIHMCCKYRYEYAKIMAYLGDIPGVYSVMTKMSNQQLVPLLDIASSIYSEYPQAKFFIDYNYLGMLNIYPELKHIDELDKCKPYGEYNGSVVTISGGENTMAKFNSTAYQDIENIVKSCGETFRRVEAHILTPKIKDIYVNKKKQTIVIKWETNETTKVTCDPKDKWDLEKGIMAAITKYVLGNNYNAYNVLDKYIKSVKGDKE